MKIKKGRWIVLTLTILFLAASLSSAQDLTGEEILKKIKGKIFLSGSGIATIKLIMENKKGKQQSNTVKVYRKANEKVKKQLIEYLEPADVRGTKLLSIVEEGKEDMMWLYLPVLGRERRVVGPSKKGYFMGTDFTYEEIGGSKSYEKKYEAKRLEDETFENYPCYVLKLNSKEKETEYTYLKMWVWKKEFIPLKIEFYEKEGKFAKSLTNSDLRKKNGEYTPYKIIMANIIKGTKTIVEILDTEREEPSDNYFTLRYLRR